MTLLPMMPVLLALSVPDAGLGTAPSCPSVADAYCYTWWELGPSMAKEPPHAGTGAKHVLAEKDRWLRDCPHNAVVWYAVLRANELISPDRKAQADLIEAARTAVPNSVWIETVRARTLGTVEAAETAARIDPKHVPARVALAAAYDRAGDHESALRMLRSIPDLGRLAGGPLLLARVAQARGDLRLAAESAKREPTSELSLIEPIDGMFLVAEARLLEGDVRLKLGQADKALTAFYEATLWRSVDASERLGSPTVELERAMEARLRKSHLDEELRCRLLEYLGEFRLRSGDVKSGIRLLVKALFLPEYSCGYDALASGGPEARKELETLRANRHLSTRERERLDNVLKSQSPQPRAVPDGKE